MTERERWRRIEALFEGALDHPPDERHAWLAAACDGDGDLRAEVAAMLAASERPGGVLDRDPAPLAAAALREAGGPSKPPPRIGPYRVEEEIGRGGMGVVYRARDERLHRALALKLLPPSLHADPEARDRFLAEARAASALEHPAICTIYDLGETDDGRLYIAMAYYPGRTLEERLARVDAEGPLPVPLALDWTIQAAEGLARAHAAGVVHRDVKPANLLVTDEGRVKLLDFGVAKLDSGASLTAPGAGLGTPAYMAPEQIRGEPVDGRADLFSLGCVLYQLLTGDRPFRADTPVVALHSVLHDEPPPVSSRRPEAPRELDRLVARCLAKRREERPASAEELAAELRAVRSGRRPGAEAGGDPASALPAALTRFLGREAEVAQVVAALREARLLTLTGPGGTGKTRLVLEAARVLAEETAEDGSEAFPDGVCFVALDPVRDPAGVAAAVGAALGVPETAARTAAEALRAHLRERRCLLVLDNFEQVVEAAPLVADLLAHCPGLRVAVTSRVLLRLSGERVFPVPPLALPPGRAPAAADLDRHPATALFLDRARAADPAFALRDEEAPAVAEICRRLDGLPLAIELAAARVRHFDPRTLLERLGRRLDLPGAAPRDAPERHQTLRRAIVWSLDLLEEAERALFRRLGAFVGGFTPEAADAVAAAGGGGPADVLESLAVLLDHSLIQHAPVPRSAAGAGGGRRYRMLDTVRELALEELRQAGDEEAVRGAHSAFFLGLAERALPHLTGPEQLAWLERLTVHQDDLRAAVRHAEDRGDAEAALRFGAALWRFWLIRGRLREGRERLERAAGLPGGAAHPPSRALRGRVLHGLGILLNNLGDNKTALRVLEESLALFRELDDRRGLADQLNNLAWVAIEVSENDRARELSREALRLHRELGDVRGEALALNNLGWVGIYEAEYARAREHLTRSLELRRRIGDPRGVAFALSTLAWADERTGRFDEAEARLREAEELLHAVDDRMLPGLTLNLRGLVARGRGELEEAAAVLERSRETWREAGNISGLAMTLAALAPVQSALGRQDEAGATAAEAGALAERVASPWLSAEVGLAAAQTALARGETAEAAARAQEALGTFRRVKDRRGVAECLETLAAAAAAEGDAEGAGRLLGAAGAVREEIGLPPLADDP